MITPADRKTLDRTIRRLVAAEVAYAQRGNRAPDEAEEAAQMLSECRTLTAALLDSLTERPAAVPTEVPA